MNSKEIEEIVNKIKRRINQLREQAEEYRVDGYELKANSRNEIANQLGVVESELQALQPKEDYKNKISRLTNFNDELFELAYNNCNGLAHDELYRIVDKYKLPQEKKLN